MLLFSDGAGGFVDLTAGASTAIYRGQHDPDDADFSGPLGGAGDASFTTSHGTVLYPTGTGRWVYVDVAATGANDGTSPTDAYTTIQAAIDDHQAGDCILVEPGVYVETTYGFLKGPAVNAFGSVKMNEATATHRVKVARRGAGRVEITAADAVGTWTQATDGQADGNPNWSNIYWSDFTPSVDVAVGNAVLLQSGVVGAITMLGAGMVTTDDMLLPQHKTLWWNGDDAGSDIADLTKSATTGTITIQSDHFLAANYPQGSLDDCEIWINAANNTVSFTTITSHDASTGEITFTSGTGQAWEGKEMALRNVLSEIGAPGQWGYRDNGDGSYRIWFWPYDNTKMAETRISKRTTAFDMEFTENWTFYGLDFTGAGGGVSTNAKVATGVISKNNSVSREGVIFEECRAYACKEGGFGLITMTGLRLYNVTADVITNGKGFLLNSGTGNIYACIKSEKTANTAISCYNQNQCALIYSRIGEVRSVHGNGASNYFYTKDFWVHGNEIDTSFSIGMTTQDSANTYWTCNVVKLGPGVANRGIEDNSTLPAGYDREGTGYSNVELVYPTPGEMSWVCNTVLPWAGATDGETTGSIQYRNTTNCAHYLGGNAVFGTVIRKDSSVTDTGPDPDVTYTSTSAGLESGNVFVGTGMTGNALLSNGGGNTLTADPDAVWVNPVSDPTPVASGPLDGSSGDHSAYLPLGETWVSDLGILSLVQQDFNGTAISYATAPRGAITT